MKKFSNHVIILILSHPIREKMLLVIKDFPVANIDAAKDFLNFK